MNNLDRLKENNIFISDLGENQEAMVEGQPTMLGRYAVWSPVTSKAHQIIEVGENLESLCMKYNVPPERVCIICK